MLKTKKKEFSEIVKKKEKRYKWDFPGSPVTKTQSFQCRGLAFYPWSGN